MKLLTQTFYSSIRQVKKWKLRTLLLVQIKQLLFAPADLVTRTNKPAVVYTSWSQQCHNGFPNKGVKDRLLDGVANPLSTIFSRVISSAGWQSQKYYTHRTKKQPVSTRTPVPYSRSVLPFWQTRVNDCKRMCTVHCAVSITLSYLRGSIALGVRLAIA